MIQEIDDNVLDLVKQKGFYPYEHMSNFEKFKEKLTGKEKFYSSLTCKKISCKEYEHVLKVWTKFGMQTVKDCHDLYSKCDVVLLADVFEKFRNNILKNYGWCPSHYLGAALIWDAMFNMTKINPELISDLDMYILFQKGMGVKFLIFLIDMVKPAISIWNLMTQNKNQSILYT